MIQINHENASAEKNYFPAFANAAALRRSFTSL